MHRVGRHTIVREISSAGVLSTFEATHDDGCTVRLRVVTGAGDLATERFEEDLARVAALRHPGIDRPLEWSAEDPLHVSTLRVRGASLREICDDAPGGRIAVNVAAGVGADLAEALFAAHSAGLVHAGLSPDSILLGTDGRARATDFALMRCLNDRASAHPEVMRGSIESLAPEQLSAPETIGAHTDVFGLGLVLYRAMTGKPAFEAPSALGMSIRLSMGKPTPIESHGLEIPDELRDLVKKMLSAAPTGRPPMDLVARTLAKHAGPFRDSVRSLARAASPAHDESESATAAPSGEATPQPAPGAPPRGVDLSSVDDEASRAAFSDASLAPSAMSDASAFPAFMESQPTEVVSGASDSVSDDPSDWYVASSSLELATQPELALPELRSQDNYPTLFEVRSPAGPSEDFESRDVDGLPAIGGDTSVWPTTEPDAYGVPKTMIIAAPSARASAPSAPPRIRPPLPSLLPEEVPEPDPPPSRAGVSGAPEWVLWTAIALAAFALLVGAATLVILVTG